MRSTRVRPSPTRTGEACLAVAVAVVLAVALRRVGIPVLCKTCRVCAEDEIEVRRLDTAEVRARLGELAGVLHDCVEGGASIGYLAPFSEQQAYDAFVAFADEIEQDRRLLVGALMDGELVGAVQVVLAMPPNQPHRGEISRMLVRRSARRQGIARRLMEQAELEARAEGKQLLVLDAVTDGDAARLYARLGWTRVGEIPGYALYPDGRFCDTTVFWKRV